MIKVRILDRCELCDDEAYIFVCEDVYAKGEMIDRYRPCEMCHGSGNGRNGLVQVSSLTYQSELLLWNLIILNLHGKSLSASIKTAATQLAFETNENLCT